MQHLLFFPLLYPYLLNFIQLNYSKSPQTTINNGVLVNATNFTIKINTINHFFNNRAQILND